MRLHRAVFAAILALGLVAVRDRALALDPHKTFTQLTRTVWTQADGLPQDSIRAIAQTRDGYLWVGTNEGLVRFDGYEFVTYTKANGALQSNLVTTLTVAQDGTLWIGTSEGVVRFSRGKFEILAGDAAPPEGPVNSLVEDHTGAIWIVTGGTLSRFADGRFREFTEQELLPVESARVVYEDPEGQLLVGGVNGMIRWTGSRFAEVTGLGSSPDRIVTHLLKTRAGLWWSDGKGLALAQPDGALRRFTVEDGLPSSRVVSILEDAEGTMWAGTYRGLARLENGRFVMPPSSDEQDRDLVWSLFEDRQGDLWAGTQSALMRFRDDPFTTFGRPEGLPSDEATAVHQDSSGRIWIGYRNGGLGRFPPDPSGPITTAHGLAGNEVFGIRDARNGDLLIATSGGLSRMHQGRFVNYMVPDPAGRTSVYDALEDRLGTLWAATSSGVYRYVQGSWEAAIPADSNPANYVVTLTEGEDGSLWAGTLLTGLWRLREAGGAAVRPRLFTTQDGLGSNRIRSFSWDPDGTLWIGTFGGGLTSFAGGQFFAYGTGDGLLSDNVSDVTDDGLGSLWLSTARGVCRVSKSDLREVRSGARDQLTPQNFGTGEGLRSPQIASAFPAGGGGTRSHDGVLWFPTRRGVATINPGKAAGHMATHSVHPATSLATQPGESPLPRPTGSGHPEQLPILHLSGIRADGEAISLEQAARLRPGTARVSFRFVGIYLRAPERVRYSYKLEGLDEAWIPAEGRRLATYNTLPHGDYRFLVRATLPGGGSTEAQLAFAVLPHFYETGWFLLAASLFLAGIVYGGYRYRLAQVHSRFAAVVEERARLAREIHDTLAQAFVGISHQLDALAGKLGEPEAARTHLDLARRMTRHSLTEARRSVLDLRTAELEEQDLPAALASSAPRWLAGSGVRLSLELAALKRPLPADLEQHLLRIVQEAVTNTVKHAQAECITIQLAVLAGRLHLCISDDGRGFQPPGRFQGSDGHFGIVGMRERTERFGGSFRLDSEAGQGTRVEVTIPMTAGFTHAD